MKSQKHMTKPSQIIVVLFLSCSQAAAIIPDAAFSEKIIKDNHYFITFINTGVSNFGSEEQKKNLYKAQQFDHNARLYHVALDFKHTFIEVRKSHVAMRDLYYDMLQNTYIKTTLEMLDAIAPQIIASKDAKAARFIQLAYRDLQDCRRYVRFGRNLNKFLYSMKIRYYIDAVKLIRRSKRYGILALMEINTPYEDKAEYKTQTLDEAIRKVEAEDLTDYERVKFKLQNFINRRLIKDPYDYMTHHNDNYGYIAKKNALFENIPNLTMDQVKK